MKQLTAAYESIVKYSAQGQHPEEYLTYEFLRKNPILLQPGIIRVNWNCIPGLTRRIDTIPTVVIPDSLWARWQTDWRDTWEPDEEPGHFIRNVALVVCRSWFNDNPDSKGKDKWVYSLAIAHVPDHLDLASLEETNTTLVGAKPDQKSVICLTRLHKAAKFYPDYFCSRRNRQLTLQHMVDRPAAAGVASNFTGAELLTVPSTSDWGVTYSKLPPRYRNSGSGDLINTSGTPYKVWEGGAGKKRPDIHNLPLAALTATVPMPKYGDFPKVIIDTEPYKQWPKTKRSKEAPSIIPPVETKQKYKPAGSAGSPAHHEDVAGDSECDSGRNSAASSQSASPARSIESVAKDLLVSSSSEDDSDTPAMSAALSGDEDQALGNEATASSGNGRESDNEGNRSEDAERRTSDREEGSNRGSDDSSSDSDDNDTSDDGGGASEAAQHLEEVYGHILKAMHKTARIMSTGYERATGDVQGIVRRAVQEVTQPNKTFIRATTAHLSLWEQALHDMLNSEGASAEERDKANREARLDGLKCIRSLLAEGEVFNEAEEQNTDEKLHDTVQAALRAANNRADKTLIKITKRVPGIVRKYVPNDQAGTFIASVYQSMGQYYSSVHGMVMSQVVVPFHIVHGTYNTSGNMFRAVNHMIPGLSAATANCRAAPPALPAVPDPDSTSQMQISVASREAPLQDTPTGRPRKEGHGEMSTPHKSATSKRSSSKAPLMTQSLRDFKSKESKIQTRGTPGSWRGSGMKEDKLDSEEIAKTWEVFEWDDARDAARRVLNMNTTTGGKALSLSDHEDNSIELLTERDAPGRDETAGQAKRKSKKETSSDEDVTRPTGSSRRKKRKTHPVDEPDMFDSDFKGKLSFNRKSASKLASTNRSTGANPTKASKRPDDDSGLGSSLSEPKKSKDKDKDKKSRKTKSTGGPDPLAEELRLKREQQEKMDRDNRATLSLLVRYRPQQYVLEEEMMKTYRSQHIAPGRAKCENTDDHSGYITFVLQHNKQSYICQSFHLFTVEAYFR